MAEEKKFFDKLEQGYKLFFWPALFPIFMSAVGTRRIIELLIKVSAMKGIWQILYHISIAFGYVFALANIGFLIWYYRHKKYKTMLSENTIYRTWAILGNSVIIGLPVSYLGAGKLWDWLP